MVTACVNIAVFRYGSTHPFTGFTNHRHTHSSSWRLAGKILGD